MLRRTPPGVKLISGGYFDSSGAGQSFSQDGNLVTHSTLAAFAEIEVGANGQQVKQDSHVTPGTQARPLPDIPFYRPDGYRPDGYRSAGG